MAPIHDAAPESWQFPAALNRIVLAEDSASDARLVVEALTDGTIFAVSSQHFDSDSYRIQKGDSQTTSR